MWVSTLMGPSGLQPHLRWTMSRICGGSSGGLDLRQRQALQENARHTHPLINAAFLGFAAHVVGAVERSQSRSVVSSHRPQCAQ